MFIVGKVIAAIILPPGIFALLAGIAAILVVRGRRRAATVLSCVDLVFVYALSTCFFSDLLVRPLEDRYRPLIELDGPKTIVVLGGGYNDSSPEYDGLGALAPAAEKRAIYGLELARRSASRLIYSGGKGYDSKIPGSEAEAAWRLWISLGADRSRITLENDSIDTKGNAKGVSAMAFGGDVILVTSAFHMPRSVLAFERQGISVMPAPTDYRAKRSPYSWSDFMPDTSRLDTSRLALHEYIGIAYYRLTM